MVNHINHQIDNIDDPTRSATLFKLATDISYCANYLIFHNYYTIEEIRLAGMISCKKHLLCPLCARIRALKSAQSYLEKYTELRKNLPNLKPVFITLTIKNGDDLTERLSHLKKAFDLVKFRRKNARQQGYGSTQLSKIHGAVFSYEVTNKGNGWHPHIHMIALVEDWIDQEALAMEWLDITSDSFIVDVRKITGNPTESFLEVFKYALKFSDMSLDLNFQAYECLRGKRLQGAFGSFWGVKVPEQMIDDLPADLPYKEILYRFKSGQGYQVQKSNLKNKQPQVLKND
jgi:hypothetical protein